VNENTIPPKVVRRIKCGHHAKTHERVYSNTPALPTERIPINMMTTPYGHQDSFLGREVILGPGAIVWPGTNCNVNRCVTMASTNTPSIFANASMDRCFYRDGVWEATEIRGLVGRGRVLGRRGD